MPYWHMHSNGLEVQQLLTQSIGMGNATVIIEALQHTTFNAPFEIKSGSTMHVK